MFKYERPKSVADFDSYKSSTISAELEHLLKRLVMLVPEDYQPNPTVMRTIDAYFTDTVTVEEVAKLSVPLTRYLLA